MPGTRPRWQVRLLCLLALGGACLWAWAHWIAPDWRFYINVSDSLPNRLYLVRLGKQSPRRGQLVAFYPPPLPEYPSQALFLKYVVAVPGDRIRVDEHNRRWYVNGHELGRIQRHTRNGRALHPGPDGNVPPGHYAVWTPAPNSYDSRYADVGWVPRHRILGHARPVL